MKVLVTGAEGYIGVWLGPWLQQRGHWVVGLDTGFYRDGWLYEPQLGTSLTCLHKDLRHITADDLGGFEAVVHLAELSNDPLGQHNPRVTYEINHRGSVDLAETCKRVGIERFVYTSSCSVYGVGADAVQTEESPTNPQTAYAHCKVLVERDVAKLADPGFSPTFLRNATAYGPSPRMRFDLVLNNLAGLAWTRKEIRMTSDGTPWRPLVHIFDICEAIACCLEAPREVIHNQVFNVGSNEANYQVRDIAQVVAAVFPDCTLTFGSNNGDNRSYRVAFDKIHAKLPGFRCHQDAWTGARQLREVFERTSMTREVFEYRAFTRLNQLKYLIETGQIDGDFFWKDS
jgi:nucleoside-diphosphate-sugar epimerase